MFRMIVPIYKYGAPVLRKTSTEIILKMIVNSCAKIFSVPSRMRRELALPLRR
jgi:hypothetical protein